MHDLVILGLRYGGGFVVLLALLVLAISYLIPPTLDFRSGRERRAIKRVYAEVRSCAAVAVVFGALFVWWSFAA